MDDSAEASLAFHNDVGNPHLATKGGQEDDELDWVDIMSDDNESGLLSLNEGDDVIETVLDEKRLF